MVLKARVRSQDDLIPSSVELTASEIAAAELIWIWEAQRPLKEDKSFYCVEKTVGTFSGGGSMAV